MAEEHGSAPSSGPSKGPLALILVLVNTVVLLGAIGVAVYTQILYKRPPITEEAERERLAAVKASPPPPAVPGLITYEPVTVNIKTTPSQARPDEGDAEHGEQIQGKLHYCTLGFSLELRDMAHQGTVEALKPVIMDRILGLLGRKSFQELVTVQGRYVLRTQILEVVNELLLKETGKKEVTVTNVFFNQFVVQ